ncbi:hypothetical protein OS493_025891 [Desmophyllum pertusum]|uniref:Uncharacterized protein n=1 Tax=Desmophyllum pertusum TaxID=174260 RepID=A0A9W9YXZ3_9CNID|nr:hypothetical protein OS493_025891 [Desmophyllum pertusum]
MEPSVSRCTTWEKISKRRGDSTRRLKVKWFVDTRPWEQALSNDRFGHVLNGNRSSLVQAVRAGADVRCFIGNKVRGYAYKAQNVALSPDGNHVAAQALNQVSMRSAHNGSEMKIKRKAYWWFKIVSTTGSRDISRWTAGKHKSPAHSSGRIGH